MSQDVKNVENSLQQQVYCIYDCQLKQYELPFVMQEAKLKDFMSQIVNEVSSSYYSNPSLFNLCKLGTFDTSTGNILQSTVDVVCKLDTYIDENRRRVQECIRTLNYLPTGYFKMPKEIQEDIQQKIDEAIKQYVKDFV